LEQLSRRRRLSADEVDELIALYQRTATHLSVVRSRSPDPPLVAHLSRIVLAGRATITGGSSMSWRAVGRFFAVTFPLEAYRTRRWWITVSVISVVLVAAMMAYLVTHPTAEQTFFTPQEIDRLVNSDFAGYYSEFHAQNFAFQVWTNNAWVAAMCLATGMFILPVFVMLSVNLFNLGLIGGVMISHGRSDLFFGLILPHGLLELTAVFVAAGVGLRIGFAWIAPGPYRTRGHAFAETARTGMVVALGLVAVLAVSGILEAFVTPSGWPAVFRVGVGVLVWLGFLGYALGLGARAARLGESADVDAHRREAAVPTS
jgi:uncharacterized membrane protein SpoIIM required for sporulation